MSNLGLLNGLGADFREISEGDSLDMLPRWEPGPRHRLVFQSAGVGRSASGRYSGRGPFAIQRLDPESGELVCLAEDPEADLLGPQVAEDGTLYYVRRPYSSQAPAANPLDALKDVVLFPVHLVLGVFKILNLLASLSRGMRSGAPGGGGADEARTLRVWGETIALDRTVREPAAGKTDPPSLVPSTWQLVRQTALGREVLAEGISSFDIAADGSVLYSNGRAVHRIAAHGAGSERMFVGDMIEQLAAL